MGFLLFFIIKIFNYFKFLDINVREKMIYIFEVYESFYLDIGVVRLFVFLFFLDIKIGKMWFILVFVWGLYGSIYGGRNLFC